MKTIIRRGVFETNSSSSHSISIASEDKEFVMDTMYPDQNGVIKIVGGEFGWDWFKHNDAETKANYIAQSYKNDQETLDKLADVIKEQTGAEKVIFKLDGYVDHDSYGVAPKTFYEMKNFIFNKNSWLFGGNDNDTASPEFYHVPEYRNGKMIHPEFKFELSIENFSETAKFLTKPTDEELSDAIYSLMSDTMITEGGRVIKDNSIMWQITRPRGIYYEIGFSLSLEQDFSTGEILLEKENNNYYYTIKKQMEEKGLFEGKDWNERSKMVTEEMKKIPGIIKTIKFTINEIKSDE